MSRILSVGPVQRAGAIESLAGACRDDLQRRAILPRGPRRACLRPMWEASIRLSLVSGAVADRSDAVRAPRSPETQRERDVALCRKPGFAILVEGRVPVGDLTVWLLARAPVPRQ